MITLILTFIKNFALDNLKSLLIGGVGIAALWMVYNAGENHVLNKDAEARLAAGNAALIKERQANDEINKIASQYESDADYFGLLASSSEGMPSASTATSQYPSASDCQRSRVYQNKVALIHALDGIIDGYRREVNVE